MRKTGAGILKFAYVADDAWEIHAALHFFALARKDRQRVIAVAMGEAGEASRVLYKVFGGWATFAGSEDGRQSAPGQLPASTMKRVFRSNKRTTRTKIFGLVGNPVGQSKGIYIHNPLYRRLGRDAIYCRFKIDDLTRFMKTFDGVLSGCSVTAPHKQAMMKFLASVDPLARTLGAVNTVVRRSRGYFGANTDARGALDAIEQRLRVSGRRFVVLGAGGAARAVAGEAVRRGARVYVANRTAQRAKGVARSLGVQWTALDNVASLEPEILVNATSVGMWPNIDATPLKEIPGTVRLAFDVIYNPAMTKFLKDAEGQGAITVTGVEMYARQAVEQIRLFTGRKPDAADVRQLFLAATRNP
jgi:3-dehydroquinate dehydratase/shikimate dehydrogenase